jgi:hypothetical protein
MLQHLWLKKSAGGSQLLYVIFDLVLTTRRDSLLSIYQKMPRR